jgi:pyruvate,water dikinase
VTPDHWVLDASGRPTGFIVGDKDIAIRRTEAGTAEEPVEGDLIEVPCLDDAQLTALHQLAHVCDQVYGAQGHDIEFAFAGGELYLLQRRPITRG